MKILILGLNYAPENIGIAVYTTGMAEYLAEQGHEVQVVAGQPYYPSWNIMSGHNAWLYKKSNENGVKITRVPHYIPSKPTGVKRMFHHISFAFSALFPMVSRAISTRPDIIINIAPSLVGAPVAKFAAFISGAKSWLHIQDFEVEAAFATGLLKSDNKLARLALWYENAILKSFDIVSTISVQMCKKLKEKGVKGDKIVEFRNWADIETIKPLDRSSIFRKKWNITTKYVALYSGNIANKQGISIIVDAAKKLHHRNDLTFVICGEGPNRVNLEKQANSLNNVRFYDLQAKEELNELMGLASVHLLPQLKNVVDLVLPSKLANMLASGRPAVVIAAKGTGLANEMEGCGLVVDPEDVLSFSLAIEKIIDNPALYDMYKKAARSQAEKRWFKNMILAQFEANLCNFSECSKIKETSE